MEKESRVGMSGDVNIGVTPIELYYRQNGMCYLKIVGFEGGEHVLYCTDGEESERTDYMCNPTQECIKCLSKFSLNIFAGRLVRSDGNEEDTGGDKVTK